MDSGGVVPVVVVLVVVYLEKLLMVALCTIGC